MNSFAKTKLSSIIFGVLVMIAGAVLLILRHMLPGFLTLIVSLILLLLSTNSYTDKTMVVGKGNRIARHPVPPRHASSRRELPGYLGADDGPV